MLFYITIIGADLNSWRLYYPYRNILIQYMFEYASKYLRRSNKVPKKKGFENSDI